MSCKQRIYTFNGEELSAKEISIKYNIPVTLIHKAFNDKKAPSLQEMIDWRYKHNINDITCFKYKGKDLLTYEYNGEILTISEISKKYKIPDRLVWKAFNDDSKPNLDEMIQWRKEKGISDINDYRCCALNQLSIKKSNHENAINLNNDSNTINLNNDSIESHIKANKNNYNNSNKHSIESNTKINKNNYIDQSLIVGGIFGCYEVVARYIKNKISYITVACLKCGMLHYDISLRYFISIIKNKDCHCSKLSHHKIIKHLPFRLQQESFNQKEKDISFYKSFIGFHLCGLKITGVLKKESNDCDIFLFNCICPKCKANFTVKAFNIITDKFRHKCSGKNKIKNYKNSSCLYAFSQKKKYKTNSCHINRDVSQDMIEMLKESVGFYTRKYGTEEFINLCLDAELTGNKEKLKKYVLP